MTKKIECQSHINKIEAQRILSVFSIWTSTVVIKNNNKFEEQAMKELKSYMRKLVEFKYKSPNFVWSLHDTIWRENEHLV